MTQDERLDYLIEKFQAEEKRAVFNPGTTIQQKQIALRSLMNIRPPKETDPEMLQVQDEYLKERIKENGITHVRDLKSVKEIYDSTLKCAGKIYLWQGDITTIDADAIVNAANSAMLGCFVPMHTCIDNCIHTFAGVQLRLECNRQMGIFRERFGDDYEQPTALPMLTPAYNLPSKNVIHITGPIVTGALTNENEKQLVACYENILDMCRDNKIDSVAICCISTGVFNFPRQRASEIAVDTVDAWLGKNPDTVNKIIFNVFLEEDKLCHEKLFRR